jgi:DNA-binding NarL/FixJ family response regulator
MDLVSTTPGVLVVDDHPSMRAVVRALVEEAGFGVVAEAGSGEEAVRLAAELRPDAVTMDLDMPGLDGADATRLVLEHVPEAQVVVVSGSDSVELLAAALAAGAVAYVPKRDAADELGPTLRALLGARV